MIENGAGRGTHARSDTPWGGNLSVVMGAHSDTPSLSAEEAHFIKKAFGDHSLSAGGNIRYIMEGKFRSFTLCEVVSMSSNLKTILAVIGGAIVLLLLFAALAGGGMGGMGGMMGGGMMGGGMIGMLFMLLFWLLVIALIVVLIVWVVQQIQR